MADVHAVHRTVQAGPPHDGQAPPGRRGHLSLQSAERVQVSAGLLVKWEERFSLVNYPIKVLLKTKKNQFIPAQLAN
jgi:hypothetical protein